MNELKIILKEVLDALGVDDPAAALAGRPPPSRAPEPAERPDDA